MSASNPTLKLPAQKVRAISLDPLRLCKKGEYGRLFRELQTRRNPYRDQVHIRTQCLLYAAAQGNLEAVCKLVKTFKFDPRYVYNGLSPLHCAIAYGHMEIVKYLVIEKGCNPKTESSQQFVCTKSGVPVGHGIPSSLLFVCKLADYSKSVSKYSLSDRPIEVSHVHVEILKFLFDHGWTYDEKESSFRKETDIFCILKFLMHSADVHDFGYLINYNHLSLCEIKKEIEKVLIDCVSNVEILKYLIREGALCVTVEMFQHVAGNVSDEVCVCLLEHCTEDVFSTAVFHTQVERMGHKQSRKEVLLDFACKHKLLTVSKHIAERNLNSQDNAGRTPLHIACEYDYLELVSFLISQQCDQSIADTDGYLALHVACMHSSLEILKLLSFDEKSKPDKFGNTVVHIACNRMREEVIDYLVKEKGCAVSDLNYKHELPLHILASHSSRGSVSQNLIAMVSDTVDVNITDSKGHTPVFNACNLPDLSIVEYLACQRQCDLAIRNKAGLLPLNCLVRKKVSMVVTTVIRVLNRNAFNVDEEDGDHNTLLHIACQKESIDLVWYLVVERRSSVNKINKEGDLPLHIACRSRSLVLVKLLSCITNLALRNKEGHTPLHIVCGRFKSKPIAQHLVSIGCRPVDNPEPFADLEIELACANESDYDLLIAIATEDNVSSSALTKACECGNVQAVRHLTHVLKYTGENQSLLRIACAHSLEMVECVIQDSEVNVAYYFDLSTPLHIACANDKTNIVKLLVKKFNCDQSVLNIDKEYPLHLSCTGSLETVKLLTITAEHILQISSSGLTPLHVACKSNKLDIVQYLLEVMKERGLEVSSVVKCGTVHPLKLACETGNVQMVKCLIQNGVNVFDILPGGNTVLHIACSVGSIEIMKYLIDSGHDTLVTNSREEFPLHIACTKNLELVEITSYKCGAAELEATTVDGLTPLHLAASSGLLDVVKYLVETRNCSLFTPDVYGNNVLAYACGFVTDSYIRKTPPTASRSVRYLVERGCSPMEQVWVKGADTKYSQPLVQQIIDQRDFHLFEALFSSEIFINCQDKDANTPLILLCKKACSLKMQGDPMGLTDKGSLINFLSREVKYLIKGRNCDQLVQNSKQELALHLACESGCYEIARHLESHCDIKNGAGDTALHIVCRKNNLPSLRRLVQESKLNAKCSVQAFNILNNESQSPLHLAVISDNEEMVKLLLSEVKDISYVCEDAKGLAPVHYASSVSVLKVLTDHNIENRDLLDSSGNSPLHTFIKSKCYPLAEFLFSIDATVDVKNSDGNTPMHLACDVEPLTLPTSNRRQKPIPVYFDLRTVKGLLSRSSSLSVQNNDGDTPLHIACRSKDVRLVNLLLESQHKVDLTIQNNSGDTPFHIACATACFPVVNALISLGKSIEAFGIKNCHGDTPFHVALGLFQQSRKGKVRQFKAKSSLEFFADNCPDINVQNNDGETLLHLSCKVVNSYSTHIVEFLVKSGADLTRVDVHNQLPLHVAASRFLELVKLSCSLTLVDWQDENGNTALHIACIHTKLEIAKFLLNEMKCNPIITNDKSQIPLHCACKKSTMNCTLIDLLAQFAPASLNYQDTDGDTPLHILCRNSNLKGVTIIAMHDCNFELQNNSGETPLHIVCSNPESPLELVKCVANCDPELKLKDSPCDTALHLACRNHSSKVIRYLLQNGHQQATQIPNQDGDLPIHILCTKSSLSSVQLVFGFFKDFDQQNVHGDTPLHIALKNDISNEIIVYLIEEAKCDVTIQNEEGDLPLHIACRNTTKFEGKLQTLLATSKTVNVQNLKRNSALHEYCIGLKNFKQAPTIFHHHLDKKVTNTLKFLLELGVKPSANIEGKFPIHLACQYASLAAVKLLEPRGLTAKSTDGNTVLHEACANITDHSLEIVQHLLNYRPPLKYSTANSEGDTALHIACRNPNLRDGIESIFKLLLQHCDINLPNKDGNTVLFELIHNRHSPDFVVYVLKTTIVNLGTVNCKKETVLHLACRHNFRSIVSFLLSQKLREIEGFINCTNTDEQTPIVLTTDREIMQLLLDNGAKSDALYKIHDKFFRDYSLSSPPEMPVSILVVGDPHAGKTTLVSSLKKEKEGTKSETIHRTAGIVPNDFKSEEYGQVIMYDFAGQPEYYASHDAIIHAIVKKLAPIVLLVVDLTYPIDHTVKAVNYWSSFISNRLQSCTDRAHLYVICSHADVVVEMGEDAQKKAKALLKAVTTALNEVKVFDFKDLLIMDCRDLKSEKLSKLRSHFVSSTKQLRRKAVFNFESHCLSVFMKQTFADQTVIPFDKLFFEVSHAAKKSQDAPKLLPKDLNELKKICRDLNDTGFIVFLESSHCSWLVLDKDALLQEVSGKLFAPSSFPEYVGVYGSPTGVVSFSKLREIFPHYDPNMLFGFLCQMEYCQEIIDDNVMKVLRMGEAKVSDKHYFFPHAVRVERPPGVWEHNKGYQFGWIMECNTSHHFNPYFVHILLLRLIFSKTDITKFDISLQSRSKIWKSGLTWFSCKGISTLVDVVNHSKVVLLVHCEDTVKEKVNSLQHRSELLKIIRGVRNEVCPAVKVNEFLFDPDNIFYPLKSTYKKDLVSFEEITKRISQREDYAFSGHGKPVKLDALLFCDPYSKLCVALSSMLHDVECYHANPHQKVLLLLALSHHLNDYFDIFVQLINPSRIHLQQLSPHTNKLLELFNLLLTRKQNTFQALTNEFKKITVFDVESKLPACEMNVSPCSCTALLEESTLQMYISTLPLYAQCLLEKELDWDNEGVDKDLNEIADKMIHWEEKGLHTLLELSHIEIHDIEVTYKYKDNPILKRRKILSTWKEKKGFDATYKNLLELFLKAGHTECAGTICTVLERREHGSKVTVEPALRQRVKIDLKDSEGRTALLTASGNGNTDTLLEKGAHVDSQDNHGYSACQDSHVKTTLRDEDADTFLRNSEKKRAFDLAVENNQCPLFIKQPSYPGILFIEGTKREEIVTAKEKTINVEDEGLSLSIPEGALPSTDPPLQLEIHPCFCGPFNVPQYVELVSPAYILNPSRKVAFQKEVLVKIWHYANLETEEDCKDMVFLSASTRPQYRGDTPVYVFKKIRGSKGLFRPREEEPVGQIALKHFCTLALGKRKRENGEEESQEAKPKHNKGYLYSARLYKAIEDKLIFCVCRYHPMYTKHCNKAVACQYGAPDNLIRCNNGVRIVACRVSLTQTCADGWAVVFKKTPPSILKDEISVQEMYEEISDLLELDYPPRIEIAIQNVPTFPETGALCLHVQGLNEESIFELLPSDVTKQVTLDTSRPAQLDTSRPAQLDTSRPAQLDTSRPAQLDTSRPAQLDTSRPTQLDTSRPAQLLPEMYHPNLEDASASTLENRPPSSHPHFSPTTATSSQPPLTMRHMAEICKCLYSLRAKWKTIGTFLCVEHGNLEAIRANYEDCGDRLTEVIAEWLKQLDPLPTRQALAEAVQYISPDKAEEIRQL